ncbi:pilus assembly protein PilP [Alteromonas lipolytica]|uniref:Pilus assembly protein PilP n=1 Tax=Alteromonas lipolytica TaxID=1856405 RepID=A0A1E8FC98_9ALTE|nr:pilus assembly protein PilP [Alteromonas lipolytica]OFI33238.1 pilus assembly protein PilP [Alteromonas lipolytica]GGF61405.1 pilus assembly protein PilP [Alteromonas lipolytica]
MRSLTRLLSIAVVALTASGCAPQIDDLVAYTNEVRLNTRPSIEPYPEFEQQPAFIYSAQDFRSPFTRPKATQAPVVLQARVNCLQPDTSRAREPLESYGIDALSFTGSFRSNGDTWVLFKTNDGGLYQAKRGSRLGLFFGRIIAIGNDKVVIEELVPDGAGCWQKKETTLTMKS